MINSRMIRIEKAGALNTRVKLRTGNAAAARLGFSYVLAVFFYTHAHVGKNTHL